MDNMKRSAGVILPLASALAALGGAVATETEAAISSEPVTAPETSATQTTQAPNILASTGETLLGFVMTDQPDGTVIAQHVSHASHASHASHHSHYSSR
jgi:hypothetical protein